MNRFARLLGHFHEVNKKRFESSRSNSLYIAILAVFRELSIKKKSGDKSSYVVPEGLFYSKLAQLEIRNTDDEVPNLTSFLAYKN